MYLGYDSRNLYAVFVAFDDTLQRRVAVKVLPEHMAAAVSVDRFRRETVRAERVHWLIMASTPIHLIWCRPTVFAGTNDMRIAREEIFGPVLSVIEFETEAEAVAIANDTQYGLAASLYTQDLDTAHRVAVHHSGVCARVQEG